MKKILNPILVLMLLTGMGTMNQSCSVIDNPADVPSSPQPAPAPAPEVTEFYNETVNKMIDEDYQKVLANGYSELIIPASLYPKGMIKLPEADSESMDYMVKAGHTAFVNGGAVRDGVLGKELHDVDFSTDATPDEVIAIIPNSHKTQAGDLTIVQAEHEGRMRTDIVTYRAIDARMKGQPGVPESPYTGQTYSKILLDDTYSRDLTINSIYYDYQTGDIIDYHGGLRDLREKIIRTPMEPNLAFTVDPQSMLRAVRFAARYEFTIEENTAKALADNLPKVEAVKPALRRYVVIKGFADGCAYRTYQYNVKYGIFDHLVPMLKDYVGQADYENYLKTVFDYIDSKKGMSPELAYAILFMKPVMKELGDKEPTLENITAAFDKLEQESGQDKLFWLEDYLYTKKDPLKIWYLTQLMTKDETLADNIKVEELKGEFCYSKVVLFINALAILDPAYKKYADFWNTGADNAVDLTKLTADYEAKDGDVLTGSTSFRITIPDGAKVMLRNVSIDNVIYCAGDATVMTARNSSNRVYNAEGYGSAIFVVADKTLTLDGGGELYAVGGIEGAGIGGNGSIVINGGSILAYGGDYGAGIGSEMSSFCGDITISGGEVAAIGGLQAAGIGSGQQSECGNISIKGTVTSVLATKGEECENAIGTGLGGTCGEITIEDESKVITQ